LPKPGSHRHEAMRGGESTLTVEYSKSCKFIHKDVNILPQDSISDMVILKEHIRVKVVD